MIRINLLGEKIDRSGVYLAQLLAYFGCIALILFVCVLYYRTALDDLEGLKKDTTSLDKQLKELERDTVEVKNLEEKEKILREKLSTIAQLKAKKHGPVHFLADLSSLIPEKAWLESMKEREGVIEIKGIALDNPTIGIFWGDLEKSKYFENVELILSEQYIRENVKMKKFSISLKVENPLTIPSSTETKGEMTKQKLGDGKEKSKNSDDLKTVPQKPKGKKSAQL